MTSITTPMSVLNMSNEKHFKCICPCDIRHGLSMQQKICTCGCITRNCTCYLGFPCDLGSRTKCTDWKNRMKVADSVSPGPMCKPTFVIEHRCDQMEGCGSCFFTNEHDSFVEQIRDFILSNILHLFDNDENNGKPLIYQYETHNTMWMCPIQIIGRCEAVADEFRTAVQSGFYIIMMEQWKHREWINNLSKTITNNLIVIMKTIEQTGGFVFTCSQCTIQGPIIGGRNGRYVPRKIHDGIFNFISNYLKAMLVQEIRVCSVTTENSWKPSYWHRPGKPWKKEWHNEANKHCKTEEEKRKYLSCGACPKALFALLPMTNNVDYDEVLLDTLDNKTCVDADTSVFWEQWTSEKHVDATNIYTTTDR